MAAWRLTTGLTTWRGEINTTFPNRKKDSDGSIGDKAHASGTSGHNDEESGHAEYNDGDSKNEVRAIDVDKDLMNPKFTMEQLIQWLVEAGRAGKYLPFRYFIYNGRIWRKATGWKTEKYTGSNKHTEHAHFSGDYTQKADEWTGKLGLAEYVKKVTNPPVKEDFPVNQADFNKLMDGWATTTNGKNVLNGLNINDKIADKANAGRTVGDVLRDLAKLRGILVGDANDTKNAALPTGSPLAVLLGLSAKMDKFFMDEVNRDGQEAARDAAMLALLNNLQALSESGAVVHMTVEQFNDLKTSVMRAVVEAGDDAATAAQQKLNRMAEALADAGERLATADDEPVSAQ